MPFCVTEEIWQDLAPRKAGESIMVPQRYASKHGEIDESAAGPVRTDKK